MEICARVYRPRRARESPLFRLVEQHLEEFQRVYGERFAKQHGPLRPVVERVLRGFLVPADPLVCRGCGGPLKIAAYITDELSIRRILDHLGLSPPEQDHTPPIREVVRVAVDDEGREIPVG